MGNYGTLYKPPTTPTRCPHCNAGEISVWDGVLEHFAHPHPTERRPDGLKLCEEPWKAREKQS